MRKADKQIRICFWCFVFFLLTEGIFRRWLLPGMSNIFLVAKDPFVIYAVLLGLNRGYVRNTNAQVMLLLSVISFLFAMTIGHGVLFVALFGARILWYFPFIYVCAKVLTRDDILLLGKILIFMFIPMVLITMIQFLSPTSFFSRTVGGGMMEVDTYDQAVQRPPGIFTYTPALTDYYGITYSFLLYFLLSEKDAKRMKLKRWFLFVCLAFYVISIPISVSRTHFFQTCLISCALLYFFRNNSKVTKRLLRIAVLILILSPILLSMPSMQTFVGKFTDRFTSANKSEGGAVTTIYNRVFFNNVSVLTRAPVFGYGTGSFTNVGKTYLYGKARGVGANLDEVSSIAGTTESEWGRVLAEEGVLLGFFILLFRVIIGLSILLQALRYANRTRDFLPWLLAPLSCEMILFVQTSLGYHVGFMAMGAIAALAAIKRPRPMLVWRPYPTAHEPGPQPARGIA